MKNLIFILLILVLPVLTFAKETLEKNDKSVNEYSAIHKDSIPYLESIWSNRINDFSTIDINPSIHNSDNHEAVNQILKEAGFASRYSHLFWYVGKNFIA